MGHCVLACPAGVQRRPMAQLPGSALAGGIPVGVQGRVEQKSACGRGGKAGVGGCCL